MTLSRKVFRTRNELLSQIVPSIVEAASGEKAHEAVVVVPARAWVEPVKQLVQRAKLAGVNVQTYTEWLDALWDVYGDGSRIVTAGQRHMLARPLLEELLGTHPSSALLEDYCSFIAEAVAVGQLPAEGLSATERRAVDSCRRYSDALAAHGLVEAASAERELVKRKPVLGCVVVAEPDARSVHANRFVESLASHANVYMLERDVSAPQAPADATRPEELAQLSQSLYTGHGGVEATGAVLAGQSHGAHVEGELVAALVKRLRARDIPYSDIGLVFANAADSYPHIQDALAREHIPFECSFSLPLRRTPFGATFLNIARLREPISQDESYRALADVAASPYAGISDQTARALQAHWRARASSTHEQRLADIANGFAQGNADARTLKERLAPLAALLEAPLSDVAEMMFSHARDSRGPFASALVDDARAANTVLAYLEQVEHFGTDICADDVAVLPVGLERACYATAGETEDAGMGPDAATNTRNADAVRIVGAADLAALRSQAVVLADLDAAHHPMARAPEAFASLLGKLGVELPDVQAQRERCLLLDAVNAANDTFVFYRVCHDRDASEACQSALWDELSTVYADEGDENAELAAIPHALADADCAVVYSEEMVFEQTIATPHENVVRGALSEEMTSRHLAQYLSGDAMPFSPTALEDYYRCPYRWFSSRRVGYNGMDNSFTASAQGNLAHDAFSAFYGEFRKRGYARVTPDNLDEARALAGEIFDATLEASADKPRTGVFVRSQLDRLACEQIREQVIALIERDAEFLPGFAPTYFELELGRGTGHMLTYAGIPVRGKVDRIDIDEHGHAVVIDYKLSKLGIGYGLESGSELPQRIQTDIYATLVQRHFELLGETIEVVGSVYRSYSGNMMRGAYAQGVDFGTVEVGKPKIDALPNGTHSFGYAGYLERVEEQLGACIERLASGDIEPQPKIAGVCEYCRALAFCPRREA